MIKTFSRETAENILNKKRKMIGRGLSYAEKILYVHQAKEQADINLVPGRDMIRLYPDRVAMQDATAQMAMLQFIQAGRKKSCVEATIHCDHLITAIEGKDTDLENAAVTNREIYDFLASAAAKFGIGFWGPGSGIIHQVLLENYAMPGLLMIGTDSHTPNAGGIGMIAIGVGGADAAEVMAGLHWETTLPYVTGVKLKGRLRGWASAKDVIFEMLNQLSVKGGTGHIFEYYGEGAESLSVTQKATITNMGAELGATSSLFVHDNTMETYLMNVGRNEDADQIGEFRNIFNQDEICLSDPEKVFHNVLEIDLDSIKPAHSGPFTPDRITKIENFNDPLTGEEWPKKVSAILLGSCTNSSYADLSAAAEVLIQAQRKGVSVKVPFLLSPGSTRTYETIKRDGILDILTDSGALILSSACGPCIGQWERRDIEEGEANCIFTTFNRNFRARNDGNPETLAFLTSPAIAASIAVSGDTGFNPETDMLKADDGTEFMFEPPNPEPLPEKGMVESHEHFVPPNDNKSQVDIKIDPESERIELLKPFDKWDGRDFEKLPILVKTKGKTTTDHISPGGEWLKYRGHITNISKNMLMGAVNACTGETGTGTNIITGEKNIPFFELAAWYRDNVGGFIIIGDENYGEGSSREHAAMSPRFMGAKAVIARSFARIHEANLKKQGILPLTFSSPEDYEIVEEYDRISLVELASIKPGDPVKSLITREDGSIYELMLNHTLTEEQIQWFRAGSALNMFRDE
ncbi:aconitate hydratase [Thermodesulfobacteriota bacterium]